MEVVTEHDHRCAECVPTSGDGHLHGTTHPTLSLSPRVKITRWSPITLGLGVCPGTQRVSHVRHSERACDCQSVTPSWTER